MKFQKRRGVSPILGGIMILAITATFAVIAISGSLNDIESETNTVSEVIKQTNAKNQELLSYVWGEITGSSTTIEVVNYGSKIIELDKLYLDGTLITVYTIEVDGNPTGGEFPLSEITEISIPQVGAIVQLVTANGNIFEFDLS